MTPAQKLHALLESKGIYKQAIALMKAHNALTESHDTPYTVRYGNPTLPEKMVFDTFSDAEAFAKEKKGRLLRTKDWHLIADYSDDDED